MSKPDPLNPLGHGDVFIFWKIVLLIKIEIF
jgi:hypothetical protein